MFSKTDHIPIIQEIARGMKLSGNNDRYLELGIAKARCFNVIVPYFKESTAVDINEDSFRYISTKSNTRVMCSTTDNFFKRNKKKFNLIFIDANHRFEFVYEDTTSAVASLTENGMVIVHDTYAPSKKYAEHCYDAWRIQGRMRYSQHYQSITLPFFYGLTLIRKHNKESWWYGV